MKRLIIRADDAGSSLSANRAIYECASRGLVRNVSLMAPGPFIHEAGQVLAGLEGVDFGLHVTLNSEWDAPRWGSVAAREQVPLLLDEAGKFTRSPQVLFERGVKDKWKLIRKLKGHTEKWQPNSTAPYLDEQRPTGSRPSLRERLQAFAANENSKLHCQAAMLDQIELEVSAQLAKLRQLGFSISYLDEHMFVGWLPGLRQRLQALATRENLHLALPIESLPFQARSSELEPRQSLLRRLDSAPEGNWLFITHPAFDDEEMRSVGDADTTPGHVARERDADRALLLDESLRTELERRQVLVARYSDVLGQVPL